MASINRDIATMLGRTEAANPSNAALGTGGGGTVSAYTLLDSLPVSDLSAGNQAFVSENNRLYVSNGSGWYNVSLINATPRWNVEPLGTNFNIDDSATPLSIIAKAADSDNADVNLLDQSFATDSAQYLVDISRDSSVFTFTPKSQDSVSANVIAGNLPLGSDSSSNDFIYTFKWSDGINFVSKAVTINYNFSPPVRSTVLLSDWGSAWTSSGGWQSTASAVTYGSTLSGNTWIASSMTDTSTWGARALININFFDHTTYSAPPLADIFWIKTSYKINNDALHSGVGNRNGIGVWMANDTYANLLNGSASNTYTSSGNSTFMTLRSDRYGGYSTLEQTWPEPYDPPNAIARYYASWKVNKVTGLVEMYHSSDDITWTLAHYAQLDANDVTNEWVGLYLTGFAREDASWYFDLELLDGEVLN